MKRKERDKNEVQWLKNGGGTFRLPSGKIIKPGQKFWALPEDIPLGVRDIIQPLTELPEEEEINPVQSEYFLKTRGRGGWYDVIDSKDKVMNEKALKKDKAEELIKSLKKG